MAGLPQEDIASWIASMDRPDLVHTLETLECSFPLDFTEEFLDSVSVERLRHIVLAASLRAKRIPIEGVRAG